MLLNKLSAKDFKRWEQTYPVAARQYAAIKGQTRFDHLATWATRHQRAWTHMYIESAIRVRADKMGVDPMRLAVEICHELEPERDLWDVMSVDYDAHVINAAGAKIHWITDRNERDCANALAELSRQATLEQIKKAFTLPYSHDDEWTESKQRPSSNTLKNWIVPGIEYQVSIENKQNYPMLKNRANYWIHPDWMTLEEAALWYGYKKTSSLRVAIHQRRLKSSKVGKIHRIRHSEIQAAIREGRLRPPK